MVDLDIKKNDLLSALANKQMPIGEQEEVKHKAANAVVAFIDMLGTSELMDGIEKENDDEAAEKAYRTIKGISKEFRTLFARWFKESDNAIYMEISDSFVIATDPILLESLLNMLSLFQFDILEKYEQPMRGGVALGKIIDGISKSERLIIGPAFVRAHLLEQNVAIFPRIVIGSELKDSVPETLISFDEDGEGYLDFIKVTKIIRGTEINLDKMKGFIDSEFIKLDSAVKPHKITQTKIKQKIGWLKSIIYSSFNGGQL